MELSSLFTILAIGVAVFALVEPIQRKTIRIFVPVWIGIFFFIGPLCLLAFKEILLVFGYEYCDKVKQVVAIVVLLFPIAGLFILLLPWYFARLHKKKDPLFTDFVSTSINEDKFDELSRIIARNQHSLHEVLSSQSIAILFHERVVKALNRFPDWLHLNLLTDTALMKKAEDKFLLSDTVIRSMIAEPASLLQYLVARRFGGREKVFMSELEENLIEKTFDEPPWYIGLRIDYPLLVYATERIDSGEFDKKYNTVDDLYLKEQGWSTRIKCPVFLFLKIHCYVLERAATLNHDTDYYVSDFSDVIRLILGRIVPSNASSSHSVGVENSLTPFVFLLKESVDSFKYLAEARTHKFNDPGSFGSDIVRIWFFSLSLILESSEKLPRDFALDCFKDYLDFLLELRHGSFGNGEAADHTKWCDLMLAQLVHSIRSDKDLEHIIRGSIQKFDMGKRHLADNKDWLVQNLE